MGVHHHGMAGGWFPWIDGLLAGSSLWVYGQTDGCMDIPSSWTCGWMDGWTNGCMGGSSLGMDELSS